MEHPYAQLAITTLAVFAIALVVSVPAAGQDTVDATRIEEEVRQVVDAFKNRLRTGDGEAALELLHPDVRIYEGGHAESREQYGSGHLAADMEFLGAVEMSASREQVIPGRDMVLYISEGTASGEFRGRTIDTHSTETLVLVLTDAGWRIRHIHWSSR